MTTPLSTALIGFGRGGAAQFAPQLVASPDYELTSIVTRDPERVAAARRMAPGARIVATVDELWDVEHDLVAISTPNATHAALAREAIARRIPVLVDKPLGVTAGEARRLVEEAQAAGVLLEVFQNRRWDGDFLTVRDLVASGALGDVRVFESRFGWWDPEPPATWKAAARVDEGGGALFDMGPHLLDQAILLFGPVASWHAELDARRSASTADDDVFVTLEHVSGVRSHIWTSCVERDMGPRFRVVGSAGTYTVDGLDPQERQADEGLTAADAVFGVDDARVGRLRDALGDHAIPTARGVYSELFAGLAAALRDGAPLPVPVEDSLRVLELIDAIHAATPVRVRA